MSLNLVTRFDGMYAWLSNFYPVQILYRGKAYPTVEHAYHAAKTTDHNWEVCIRSASTPAAAKRMGRQSPLRPDWDEVRVSVMRELITLKFEHPVLRQKLLDTGTTLLIEGNNWNDTFWGVCRGYGKNQLGLLIMEERERLNSPVD